MTDEMPTFTHTQVPHAWKSTNSSLAKSTTKLWATPRHYEDNERSLAPTQSTPGRLTIAPHPTHTHTMATPEPGVPLCNSITQRHTPVLILSRLKKVWQKWQEKNCNAWGELEGNEWSPKAGAQCVCSRVVDNITEGETYSRQSMVLCVCPYHQSLINH